jgi:hypothetical protein
MSLRSRFSSAGFAHLLKVAGPGILACAFIGSAAAQIPLPPLPPNAINPVMGFETVEGWIVKSSFPSTRVSSTTTRTQGSFALALVNPASGTTMTSLRVPSTASALGGVGETGAIFEVDLMPPAPHVTGGSLKLSVSSPSRGLKNELLEGHATEPLLAATLDSAKNKGADRLLPDRLAALFRQRPEATTAAISLLRKNGPTKRITDALGSAGSPAAVDALGSIARDRTLPRPLRIDALTAFILAQHPSVVAMRTPAALLDDDDVSIASAARIVSGALARAGRATHPAEADRIDAALVARYRKAQGIEEAQGLLAALGNSLGPSVTPVIENASHDPRVPVRAAAARALRLAVGPEVDRLLSAIITDDRDPGVRAAAIFAVSFRHPISPALGEALVHAASVDPVKYVRRGAVTLLRQNPNASPRIPETLAWIAEHDSQPGVRRLAQETLTSK